MDDTAGKEKITTHAQYDMNTSVGHDQTNTVTNNRSTKVGVDHDETVGGKQTIKVTGHRKLTVDGDRMSPLPARMTLRCQLTKALLLDPAKT